MDEGYGLELLSVSFAAGIAAGGLLNSCAPEAYAEAGAFFILWWLSAAAALSGRFRGRVWTVMAAAFTCGVFCSLSSHISGTAGSPSFALRAAGRFSEAIDEAGFRSSGTAPLAKALLLGDRSGLGRDVVSAFRRSGASHILALSGLHLGIVYSLILALWAPFGGLRSAKRIRSLASIGLCGFYTVMTGAGPSVVRAFIFIVFNEAATLSGRERSARKILSGALMLQLALSPGAITSAGFQLSYLAVAGIIYIHPFLRDLYPSGGKGDVPAMVWNAATLSISCQVTTAPLVWILFRTFPEYFLITNLLALPLTELLIVSALSCTALSSAGFADGTLAAVTDFLARALTGLLDAIASMPDGA